MAYGLRSERVVRRAHTYRLIHLLGLAIPFSRSFLHLARPTGFYPSRPISMTSCHLKCNDTTFCASYDHHPPRTRVLAARSTILYPSPGFPRPAYQPSCGRAEVVRIRSGQRRRAASAAARTLSGGAAARGPTAALPRALRVYSVKYQWTSLHITVNHSHMPYRVFRVDAGSQTTRHDTQS